MISHSAKSFQVSMWGSRDRVRIPLSNVELFLLTFMEFDIVILAFLCS